MIEAEEVERRENGRAQYNPRIRDMPADTRPRERLLLAGAEALSSQELLAIIWRTGTASESVLSLANNAIARFNGLAGLHSASIEEIKGLKGIGEAKAIELKAALELGRRLLLTRPDERAVVRSPADVANLMPEMAFYDQERLRVVLLNTKNHVVATAEVYKGSVNQSQVRVGELFKDAIRQNCLNLILVHNHPSGDPTPSPDDVRLTDQVVQAGKLLDINVLDHIVIGRHKFISLKERGLGFRA